MRAPKLLAPLLATAAFMAAEPALASLTYPQTLSDTLGMPCVPLCVVCHSTNVGGVGTVVTAFGQNAMKLYGLQGLTKGGSDALLVQTLNAMRTNATNSDGAEEIDVDELAYGGDPSVVGGDVCRGPKFGCGATIAPVPLRRGTDPTAAAAALLTALAGVLVLRRRRR